MRQTSDFLKEHYPGGVTELGEHTTSSDQAKRLLTAQVRGTARVRLREAFRLTSGVLADEPEEWPTQLVGRLLSEKSPAVRRILRVVIESQAGVWLRPVRASLIAAGSPIIEIINAGGRNDDSRAFSWSPDRSEFTVFSGTAFHTWDIAARREVGRLELPIEWGRAAIANPPTRAVVMVAQRQLLFVNLKIASADVIPHEGVMEGVAISADGRWAVTTSVPSEWDYSTHDWEGPRTLRLFDLRKKLCVRTWQAHGALIRDLALSADGRFLVTGSYDQTARLFDLHAGKIMNVWKSARRMIAVAITPDGRRVAHASEGGVLTIRRQDGQMLRRVPRCWAEPGCLSLSDDGTRAVMACGGDVSVFDIRKAKRFGPFAGIQPYLSSLVIDGRARHAITGENGNRLVLWDLTRKTKASPEESWISGIWASHNKALVSDSDGLSEWVLASGERTNVWPQRKGQVSAAPSAGIWAVASWSPTGGGQIRVGKWGRKQTSLLFRSKESFAGIQTVIQISRNGARVVVPVHPLGCRVFNIDDGRVVWQRERLDLGVKACLSPSGSHLLLFPLTGALEVVDLETDKSVRRDLPQPGYGSILFSSEGDCVLLPQGEETALWNWGTDTLTTLFPGIPSSISNDGEWIVTKSGTRKLNLWNAAERRRVATYTTDSPVLQTALSPDGRFLVVGDQRGGVHILERGAPRSSTASR